MGEDAIEYDEMDSFVIEAVIQGAYLVLPVFTKIEVIIMLTDDVPDFAPQIGHDLQAVIQFLLFAQLSEITAKEEEIRSRL
jgi:hypothetical protein